MKPNAKLLTTLLSAAWLAAWPTLAQNPPAPPADGPLASVHIDIDATPARMHGKAAPEGRTATAGKATMLGVVVERISEDLRYQLPLIKPGAGLIVRELVKDGPAAQANLAMMDILLRWNDQLLVHPAQLQVLVQSSKPGDKVDLEYLHQGTLTKAQITLAEMTAPPATGSKHFKLGGFDITPDLTLGALQGTDILKAALNAVGKSDLDPEVIGGVLKSLDLGKLDPSPLVDSKVVFIMPDGTRKEISLGEVLKANGNLGDLLKNLDLGKLDPAALLTGKVMLVGPDGHSREINLSDVLKSSAALGDLLKGLGPPVAP
ncbi:MAG: PDZ domain-containing protein [Verrucomicrobia bacterium]|nr:PDZ domain-containing protein [Verrucomicrobiota bacterium]